MKLHALALVGLAGTALMAGTATADFTNVTFTSTTGANGTSYRFFANFDNAADSLLAISGNDNITLRFETDTVLYNSGGAFDGLKQEDFAQFPIAPADDSWVTIGASTFSPNATNYSPGFLNNDGISAVIVGSSFSDNNDGWFNGDPGNPISGSSILIAQFTVADAPNPGQGGLVSLQGSVDWQSAAGELLSSNFSAGNLPAPGALALLGLAGLAGRRRRRA